MTDNRKIALSALLTTHYSLSDTAILSQYVMKYGVYPIYDTYINFSEKIDEVVTINGEDNTIYKHLLGIINEDLKIDGLYELVYKNIDSERLNDSQDDVSILVSVIGTNNTMVFLERSNIHILSDRDIYEIDYPIIKMAIEVKNIISKKGGRKIGTIVSEDNSLSVRLTPIHKNYDDLNISEHYNNDFNEIYPDLVKSLNNTTKQGLYIFRGMPGTGKTTLIRHLMGKVNRPIIFLPSSMVHALASPDLFPLLLGNKNSILLIEEAENALRDRKNSGDSSAVSNILNISDGILGDILNIQVICTFNADLKDIDDALLRKGRLLYNYEFKKLDVDKTNNLLRKLDKQEVSVPLTLAEIYQDGKETKKSKKHIGFK